MTFYSQFGEDRWLYHSGLLPEKGVYVDVGCNDAAHGNNCAMLRDMGWDGLSIDALDYSAQYAAIGARFVQAVVSDKPEERFLSGCAAPLARVCNEGELVQAVTLYDLIHAVFPVTRVDLLSMDVEGHEMECLMSGQWIQPPRFIISEYATASITGGPDMYDYRVRDHLLSCGYDIVWESCSNHIFYKP